MSNEPVKRKVVKRVKNAVLFNDGCIRIDNVYASYPHLNEPWAKTELNPDGSKPKKKYGVTGLGDKDTHNEAKSLCAQEINRLIEESKLGKIKPADKFCRDGDQEGKAEAENRWLFRASENANKKPSIRNRAGTKITDPDEILALIHPGALVNILLKPWVQKNDHGRKVNANLIAVQYVGEGLHFGEGSIDDEDAFEAYESEDDDGFNDNDDDEI